MKQAGGMVYTRTGLWMAAGVLLWGCYGAEIGAAGDVEDALAAWRALFPGRAYVCWEKSPWDNLLPVQLPPAAPRECTGLAVSTGRDEYESCSFVVTSLSDDPLVVGVAVTNPAVPVVLRQAMWVTAYDGAEVDDALPLLEGSLTIPSGESREVWLTVHSRGVTSGTYDMTVGITTNGLPAMVIPLNACIYPVTLPADKPLYTYYWDDLTPSWITPELTSAIVKDLRQHYVNVATAHPWTTRMQFDGEGNLVTDYTDLDQMLDAYDVLNPRKLLLFWAAWGWMEPQPDFFSEAWKAMFRTWLTSLMQHLSDRGWGYDRVVMYPYDERLHLQVAAMLQLIKETDPLIQTYVNTAGAYTYEVEAAAPYVDIWCPFLWDYLNWPPYDLNADVVALADQLLRKQDEFFWTYANPLGVYPKLASPYRDYRIPVWRAWDLGMRGFGYWAYSYKTHWDSEGHVDGPNWAVVYHSDAPDAPAGISTNELIVTGKRWEATREGVEDYVYLFMLRETTRESGQRGGQGRGLDDARTVLLDRPAAVLGDADDHQLADAAKLAVLESITILEGSFPLTNNVLLNGSMEVGGGPATPARYWDDGNEGMTGMTTDTPDASIQSVRVLNDGTENYQGKIRQDCLVAPGAIAWKLSFAYKGDNPRWHLFDEWYTTLGADHPSDYVPGRDHAVWTDYTTGWHATTPGSTWFRLMLYDISPNAEPTLFDNVVLAVRFPPPPTVILTR